MLAATLPWFATPQVEADTARFVVIQCPPEVEREASAELTEARKRGDEATMAAVLKREGVKTLVDSTMPDPWRGEPVSVQGLAGDDLPVQPEMDGKNVIIEVEGFRGKDFVRQQAKIEVRVAGKSKGKIRLLNADLPVVVPELGQWQELARWQDPGGPVSVWQFSERDQAEANLKSPEEDEERWRQFRVEFHGFNLGRAAGVLDHSTPEAAEKALAALKRGSKTWGEGSFSCSMERRGRWQVFHDTIEEGAHVERDTESVEMSISTNGRDLIAEGIVDNNSRGKATSGSWFKGYVTPGVWQFQEVKDFPGLNLLAWRVMRTDAILGGRERAGSPKSWTCRLHPDGEAVVAGIAGIREDKVALVVGGKTVIHPWESFSKEDRGVLILWRGVTEGPQKLEQGTAVYDFTGPRVEKRVEIDFAGSRARVRCGISDVRLDAATGHFISERKQADGSRSVWAGCYPQAPEAAWKKSGTATPPDPGALPFKATPGFPGLHLDPKCFAGEGEAAVEAMVSRIDAPGLLAALRICFDPLPATEEGGKTSWPSPDVLGRPWWAGSAGHFAVLREAKVLPVAYHREVTRKETWAPDGAWKLRLRSLDPVSKVTIKFPEDVLKMPPGTMKKTVTGP